MAWNLRWLGIARLDAETLRAARRIPQPVRDHVRVRDRGLCRYCGGPARRYWELMPGQFPDLRTRENYDHVVPASQGGLGTIKNIVLACYPCNETKGARTPEQAGMTLLPPGTREMPWLKSDDKMPRNDKVWDLSDAAYRLMDAGRHYSAEKLTDGWVPASRISSLTPHPSTKKVVEELLRARLWHRIPELCQSCIDQRAKHRAGALPRGGYIVHDYLYYNPSKVEWEEQHRTKSEAGKRGASVRYSRSHSTSHDTSDSTTHSPYPVPRTPEVLSEQGRLGSALRPVGDVARDFTSKLA